MANNVAQEDKRVDEDEEAGDGGVAGGWRRWGDGGTRGWHGANSQGRAGEWREHPCPSELRGRARGKTRAWAHGTKNTVVLKPRFIAFEWTLDCFHIESDLN